MSEGENYDVIAERINIEYFIFELFNCQDQALFYSRLGGGTPRQLRGATEAAGGTTGGEESGVTEGDSSFRIFLTL